MVDFEGLVKGQKGPIIFDLEKLYASLDVKGTHTELRPAQREAMREISSRKDSKDLVLKISTGAGKTAVGLIFLYAHMKISRAPVVYLCPTIQLVEQVLEEAERLGIRAIHYPGGEAYPDAACVRGDAVLVCTYEKLFNAKTTFVRTDVNLVPHAIVLDDAHAGMEIVRRKFTLRLQGDAFTALCEILGPACKAYNKTKWLDIEGGDQQALFEVPHWIVGRNAKNVQEELHKFSQTEDFIFVWPYLEGIISSCRCVISGSFAELAPEVLPTYIVRPFEQAKHRLFMSATLVDDSLLVRDFGVTVEAATNPIRPPSDRGLGERMILAPSLVDPSLDKQYVMHLCGELSKKCNVVVLTASEDDARAWQESGARYYSGDKFSEGVEKLRTPGSGVNYAVFAQRYDGVDLPDDACRVLVIDGRPFGEGLVDRVDAQTAFTPGGVRNKTVFRIEQGMGRAVRSHADFAVVLLVGDDLATYVGRRDVLDTITPDTRNQLELSIELADLARRSSPDNPDLAVRKIIDQSLARDQGWKSFYAQRVREAKVPTQEPNVWRAKLAHEERQAFWMAQNNQAVDGKRKFESAIDSSPLLDEERGIYLQRLSRITHITDPVEAIKIQQGARSRNYSVAIPPEAPRRPPSPGSKTTAERICAWLKDFHQLNAAVIEARRIADNLDLSGAPKIIEAAIRDLGEGLGAESYRPENDYGVGPDNLWFWGNRCFVIEVKNQNQYELNKTDSGQLHDSVQWTRTNYPAFVDRIQPLVVARVTAVGDGANFPNSTRVLTTEGCQAMGVAFHQLCQKLAMQGPVFVTPDNVLAEMSNFGLLPEQFIGRHTKKLS